MASGLNKHHILEAIDKLRSRKSRPDVLRIVSYVSKKYEFPKNDIKEYLEMLSKDGTVLKVEFKGSISYRNAANYRNVMPKTLSGINEESCSDRESISDSVAEALAQLIVQEPDYLDVGISMNDLYKHIDLRFRKTLTKNCFREILQKEVKNGNLVRYENGNYCLGYPNGEQSSLSSNMSDASQVSNDKCKEKSKSPIGTIRKYATMSRHSSPSSSKNNMTNSIVLTEKTGGSSKPSATPRTYAKTYKKSQGKLLECNQKNSVRDKTELSPVRESSRRKRFQKIVFDPSDSPKPKRMKEKETVILIQNNKKMRGSYNRKAVRDNEFSTDYVSERNSKKEGSVPVTGSQLRQSAKCNASKAEETEAKAEDEDETTEEESENEILSREEKCCKICLLSIDLKPNRVSERWFACQLCGKRAHVACVENTEQWSGFKFSKWQCSDCRCCVACKGTKSSNDAGLVLCGLCDDAYHMKCANIKKSKSTGQKWFCTKCSGAFDDEVKTKKEFESTEVTSNESSRRTTPDLENKKELERFEEEDGEELDEEVEDNEEAEEEEEDEGVVSKSKKDGDEIDETIPDCSNWSCEQVYSYFLKFVLPEEADVFRDQEIDGRVLLLLNRYDVLSDFKLKLGPALKIYAQVRRLQVRKNDPYLNWP